jgi:hypothetical protein
MKSLADSDDIKLFETTPVKKLIEFQWPVILKYIWMKLMVPYIIFMICYTIYIHGYFSEENAIMTRDAKIGFITALAISAGYILAIELF